MSRRSGPDAVPAPSGDTLFSLVWTHLGLPTFEHSVRGGVMLAPGDIAPDFTLKTHDGQSLTLSNLRGKNVVLWFYPKADTPG